MKYTVHILSFILLLSSCSDLNQESGSGTSVKMPELIDYNIHVKPIFSDRCFTCHGPDKANQKAGLALFESESAYSELKENPGHFAIIPGKIEKSEVINRIMTTSEEKMMPPPESNLKLSNYEKDLITK